MTADFDRAIALVLEHEGGYANHPKDPGKETKFGISKAAFPEVDVKHLTLPQAEEIYRRHYWDEYHCGTLPWPLALVMFDCFIQFSPRNPILWLQAAVGVRADGRLGPVTLGAARAHPDPGKAAAGVMADRAVYRLQHPAFMTFAKGWERRDVWVLFEAVRGDS
ncbi:MAG: hypothetical protein K2X87_30910 [Gemmataceae bacterium]|nr:hypothetical protein [Gemmataceae bacterium]